MASLPIANADITRFFHRWLDTFAGFVRDVDYASARPLFHPGDNQARGKVGRVNVSEPLMTPRNGQLRRWDEDRGDRAWPLGEGASGGRRDRTGRESTAGPRGKEGTQSGRDSDVRNVETPSGSR